MGEQPKKLVLPGQAQDDASNWVDYRQLTGGTQFVNKDGSTDLFKEVPKDPKDYSLYKGAVEAEMQDVMQGQVLFTVSARCEYLDEHGQLVRMQGVNGWLPGHRGLPFMFACDHVIAQDKITPEGVYFIPFEKDGKLGYFLCATCFRLMQAYRLNVRREVMTKCSKCVEDAVNRVIQKHPDRYFDWRTWK